MEPSHVRAPLLAAAVAGALLAGCGGGSDGSATAKSSSGAAADAVTISNFTFSPSTITVKRGAQVTVTNSDSTAHTATSDHGSSFDTGDIDPGSSKTITVTKPGSYSYHCSIHPFMHGKLAVQ